jgi:integrase
MWQRGGTYYARFRAQGRLVRKRLSSDLHVASELLNDLKARADRADFNLLDNDLALAELRALWLGHCRQTLRPRSVKRYEQNLTSILSKMPARTAAQVTVRLVTAYRQDRLDAGVAPRTVNMEVGALSTMLRWGVAHQMIGSNPIERVRPLPTDQRRKERRSLSIKEVEKLFEASPDYLKPVWRMFMVTGIRHDELVEMRFADVDFEAGTVTVRAHTAKSHKAREIPLDDAMLETIRQLREGGQEASAGRRGDSRTDRAAAEELFQRARVCDQGQHALEE